MSNYTGFLPNTVYDNIVEIPLASLPSMMPVGEEMTYLGMKCVILGRVGENLQLAVERPAYKTSKAPNMVPLTVTNGSIQSGSATYAGKLEWVNFDKEALLKMFEGFMSEPSDIQPLPKMFGSETLNEGTMNSYDDAIKESVDALYMDGAQVLTDEDWKTLDLAKQQGGFLVPMSFTDAITTGLGIAPTTLAGGAITLDSLLSIHSESIPSSPGCSAWDQSHWSSAVPSRPEEGRHECLPSPGWKVPQG